MSKTLLHFVILKLVILKTHFVMIVEFCLQSNCYKENKNLFIFERIGLFQTICISCDSKNAVSKVDANDDNALDNVVINTDDNTEKKSTFGKDGTSNAGDDVTIVVAETVVTDNELNLFDLETDATINLTEERKHDDENGDVVDTVMIDNRSTNDKRMQQVAMIQMVHDQIQEEFNGGHGFGGHFNTGLNLDVLIQSFGRSRSHDTPTSNSAVSNEKFDDHIVMTEILGQDRHH